MDLSQSFFTKNSILTILSLTLTLSVVLVFCLPSNVSYAQTYSYDPSLTINRYPSTSNIYPYPSTYPYPTSQGNSPFLGLAQYGLTQSVSPWFPSIPAISCGLGKFSFNILGVPDEGGEPETDELMAIKIIASNNRLIITDRDVSGLIFVGEKNIEENDGEDFDIKTLFNDCQTLMYSR